MKLVLSYVASHIGHNIDLNIAIRKRNKVQQLNTTKLPIFYKEHYDVLVRFLNTQPENMTKTSIALSLADMLEEDNGKFLREKWLRQLRIPNNIRFIGESKLNE